MFCLCLFDIDVFLVVVCCWGGFFGGVCVFCLFGFSVGTECMKINLCYNIVALSI